MLRAFAAVPGTPGSAMCACPFCRRPDTARWEDTDIDALPGATPYADDQMIVALRFHCACCGGAWHVLCAPFDVDTGLEDPPDNLPQLADGGATRRPL